MTKIARNVPFRPTPYAIRVRTREVGTYRIGEQGHKVGTYI